MELPAIHAIRTALAFAPRSVPRISPPVMGGISGALRRPTALPRNLTTAHLSETG